MKKLYFLFLLLLTVKVAAQQAEWITGIEGAVSVTNTFSVDGQGNAYIYGLLNESIQGADYQVTLPDGHQMDSYIVKVSPSGQKLWIQAISGMGVQVITDITCDGPGNVYITGSYNGATTIGTVSLTGVGSFVAKYDTGGNLLWAKSFSAAITDRIAVSSSGDIFVAGRFQVQMAYDAAIFTNTTTSAETYTSYLLKLTATGGLNWGTIADNTTDPNSNNLIQGLAADSAGNVYIAGWSAKGKVTFGSVILNNTAAHNSFLVKYSASGATLWGKRSGNSCNSQGTAVAIDPQDNVIFTGNYCGSLTIAGTVLSGAASSKMVLIKYAPDGTAQWVKTPAGNTTCWNYSCDTDAAGNIFVSGSFYQSVDLGNSVTATTTDGAQFFAKYSPDGIAQWMMKSSNMLAAQNALIKCYGTNTLYGGGVFLNEETVQIGGLSYTGTGDEYAGNLYLFRMTDASLSAQENKMQETAFYPNPASDSITIITDATVGRIVVTDSNGRQVAEAEGASRVNVAGLAAGMYFLKAYTDRGMQVSKFIKK